MGDLFWLWRSGNDEKCSFLIFWCIYTFRTDESIWKKPRFSQKNAAFALISRRVFNAAEGVPEGAVHDQNKTCLKQTSCSDLQWARAHLEWRGDAQNALYLNSLGAWACEN